MEQTRRRTAIYVVARPGQRVNNMGALTGQAWGFVKFRGRKWHINGAAFLVRSEGGTPPKDRKDVHENT